MPHQMDEQELKAQLNLIEAMIAEGRRTTEHWSWAYVLWGLAYMVAIAWTAWGSHKAIAWPVTMIAAALLTWLLASRDGEKRAETTLGRAVGAIWLAMGISMFVLFPALGFSGHIIDARVFVAAASAFLGMANAASGVLLRWRAQFASAVGWWAATVLSCLVTESQAILVFLGAILLCNIVFGIYGMTREARGRRSRGAVHA